MKRKPKLPNRSRNPWALLRRRARLSQYDLARMFGVSRSMISMIEAGERKCPEEIQAQYHGLRGA